MKKLIIVALFVVFIVALGGWSLSKAKINKIDEDFYCVVNRDIIAFYNPATNICTPFGTQITFGENECIKIRELYTKGGCRPKQEACTNFGRGEEPSLGCINNKQEAMRILLNK